jgi:hypothetical protein
MSWDGDLRRWTTVTALPGDGMQEVRGSNPRSSTSRHISRSEGIFAVAITAWSPVWTSEKACTPAASGWRFRSSRAVFVLGAGLLRR